MDYGCVCMNSVVLVPFCPLPANTGAKIEMWKHLDVLLALGVCTIVSAGKRPVGCDWTPEALAAVEAKGFKVILRERDVSRLSILQWWGMVYASVAKVFKLELAFGHMNPYHRYAFPAEWWKKQTLGMDLAVINYSYWSWLPCNCPKAVVLHDLYSSVMKGGSQKEVEDLKKSDLVIVISRNEEDILQKRGLRNILWSPPMADAVRVEDACSVGMVGSVNWMNREGLAWLEQSKEDLGGIRVYGSLANFVKDAHLVAVGQYDATDEPYRDCGIILMTTAIGSGVQIKAIEALAAGRAIVARRGAMRGIPEGDGAWLEVGTPDEMLQEARRLQADAGARLAQMKAARAYYEQYLNAGEIGQALKNAYLDMGRKADGRG